MDKLLEGFYWGTIQDCRNLLEILNSNQIDIEEFFKWVEERGKHRLPEPFRRKVPPPPKEVIKRRCPECKFYLDLWEVNHKKSAMVGDNYKCQWFCGKCGFEEYSINDIKEEARPYIKEIV